jgi:hypothetical protein
LISALDGAVFSLLAPAAVFAGNVRPPSALPERATGTDHDAETFSELQ